VDRLIAPLVLFGAFYLATFLLTVRLTPWTQWAALLSVMVATAGAIALWDRGHWNLGLFIPASAGTREFLLGGAFAVALIGSADLIVVITTGTRHVAGSGFPFLEMALVFVPAVLHEELLFRGYAFQRLWRWKRWVAVWIGALVFAALHAGNAAVTPLALFNVFLGGLLLSLAYGTFERLWFPIGIHFGWNLMSGPILGYEVSGYAPEESLLRTVIEGPGILTGGAFGIEGSIIMTMVEAVAVVTLWRTTRKVEC
jgi:uncharacterized protein